MNKFAQGPTLVPMRKVWPVESSTTQHVIVNPSATQNNLSEPQLAHSSKGLPEHQPSPPKYQPPPGNFALKPVDQSSSSRISSATAPSSEGNSVGVPQFRINSNWRKDIPQPSQGTQSLIVDPPATQTKLSETPPANSLLGFPERQRQLSLLKQTQLSDKVAPKSVDPPSSSTTSATPEPSSGRSPVGILRTGSNRDWLKPIAPPHQDKPSTTQQLLVNPPANENIPPKTPPSYSSNSLPERQLSLPKYQPQQESSDFAFKPVDLPSTPKASSSLEPISESKFKIHEWRQPNPQPLEVIPVKENSATVARPLPASETDGHRHKPVYVSKDGRILGPADGSYIVPATTADPSSGSHIDHMHKPVHETASGRAALGPSDRKYDGSATAASPSPDHVHRPVFVHAPSERAGKDTTILKVMFIIQG
ncbi:hypothetical protein V9T40_005234 [Parthenolecanium corni]|uniref:Uncharacterized protein n=1 Tax=Parthenolecanium corni TaxID=536013 RepID=A0AAN9TUM9_9HEMI